MAERNPGIDGPGERPEQLSGASTPLTELASPRAEKRRLGQVQPLHYPEGTEGA